jgi:hypothetical protein
VRRTAFQSAGSSGGGICSTRGDDLLADHVDDPVQDVRLVLDMVVERHRLDPAVLAERAHRQPFDPALVGEADRRAEDALPRQAHEPSSRVPPPQIHLTAYAR